ncbi:MAG: cytochrome c [Deltaproteobacteria bacterium]|nr:cytochrome c [Deltaproteobacteria bacterium]
MKHPIFILLLILPALALTAAGDFPMARRLINTQGCKACHKLEGFGGDFARPLDGVGDTLSETQLEQKLKTGNTAPYMPGHQHLTQEERTSLAQFLKSLRGQEKKRPAQRPASSSRKRS